MRRLRITATILLAACLVLGSALPALADKSPEKHKSCQMFGSIIWAGFAQGSVPSGQIIAENADGVEAPWGTTYSGPGSIADIVHDEQTQVDFIDFAPGEGDDLFGCEEF
jgi:hypothetical protein